MFLLVRRLLKLGISMVNELLCLSKSIPSIFALLAFVSSCRFAKFYSVVLHGSPVFKIVSLECLSYNLNHPCRNKLMVCDFNLFIFTFSPNHQNIYKHIISYFLNSLSKFLPTVVKMSIQSSLLYKR